MVLCKLLIQTNVAFGIIVSKDGANSAQQDRHALVSTCETMVQIGEDREVLAVLG